MHLDVLDLRNFYYRSVLGRTAQRAIRDRLLALWPAAEGATVAGYGFAVPLLRPYLGSARRVIALMPAQQGVMPWPVGGPNISLLCEERNWPVPSDAIDRLVVMHGLEGSETPGAVLDEAWRVLAPGGRAMFIVPNRAGLWSRWDGTPFGFGRPYTAAQIEGQLRAHGFTPERLASALYIPPSGRGIWLRWAGMWERAGARLVPWRGGGVLMVEATKLVLTPRRGGRLVGVGRRAEAIAGSGQPA